MTDMTQADHLVSSRRSLLFGSLAGVGALALPASMASAGLGAQAAPSLLPIATDAVEPFRVRIAASDISSLRDRLRQTRWPDKETVNDWTQGAPLEKVQQLVGYWRDG